MLSLSGNRIILLLLITSVLGNAIGCNRIPFYRNGSKNSQGVMLAREGVTAFERGEYESAEQKLALSLELNETDSETSRYYAETLWRRGEREKALRILAEAIGKAETQEDQAALFLALGEKYLELGRMNDTAACAERVIAINPHKYQGWRILAMSEEKQGNFSKALADYQKALAFDPDNIELLQAIGNIQIRLGNFDLALALWQRMARLYPPGMEPTDVLYGKAYALFYMNRFHEATEDLSLAVAKSPDRRELYELLVETHLKRGNLQEAEAITRWMAGTWPNAPESQRLALHLDQYKLALQTGTQLH